MVRADAFAVAPGSVARAADDARLRRLTWFGLLMLVLTLAALALHVPGSDTIDPLSHRVGFVTLTALAALLQLVAVATVLRGVPPRAIWLVIAVAAALRIGPLMAPPFLSSDVYRYVWDGRVQAAGINPYLYVPAASTLAPLRDEAVYPLVNRAATAHTIYPPAAQAIFAAVGIAAPTVTAMKGTMVAFEALAMACAAAVLVRLGLSPARIVVWAWNPLAVWSFAGNGHIDAAAAGLLALALLLAGRGRGAWSGVAFAMAALTKFLPLAAAPALWPAGRWRFVTATFATIVALYACYGGAGVHVLGFLPGYGSEEGLTDGSGIWLLAGLAYVLPLPSAVVVAYAVIAACGLAALGLWLALLARPQSPVEIWRATGLLMVGATLAISPHYPWYFAWLALPAMVAPSRALVWLATAPVLLEVNPLGGQFLWPALVLYLPALVLAFADVRRAPSPAVAPGRTA
jgi:hypothetical protein